MSNQCHWPSGWSIVRSIGTGSFGAVYEIERDVVGTIEKAALKVIRIPQKEDDIEDCLYDGYTQDEVKNRYRSYLEEIVNEYKIMSQLKGYTNIVNVSDLYYEKQANGYGWNIYYKMELLTPLKQKLEKNISEEEVIKLGIDICTALELCKKNNIIHRDIKPQNILVSRFGDYKLGDFGIAKVVDKTTCGTLAGTIDYMAPEVYNNQPYGASVDLYSLGMVLYWMLNERRLPFILQSPSKTTGTEEADARRRRFLGEPLPDPAHGSIELKRIVKKACAFYPEQRYAVPEEMLYDLKKLFNKYKSDADLKDSENEKKETDKKQVHDLKDDPDKATIALGKKKEKSRKEKKNINKKWIYFSALGVGVLFMIMVLVMMFVKRTKEVYLPTQREMISDVARMLREDDISYGIVDLIVLEEKENEKFQTYVAECEVIVNADGREKTYIVTLIYELENFEWMYSNLSRYEESM